MLDRIYVLAIEVLVFACVAAMVGIPIGFLGGVYGLMIRARCKILSSIRIRTFSFRHWKLSRLAAHPAFSYRRSVS